MEYLVSILKVKSKNNLKREESLYLKQRRQYLEAGPFCETEAVRKSIT
jgi:hypothetical protein